jgi:lysozyme family protein
MLQQAVGVEADGVIGPRTLAAVGKLPPSDVCSLFLAMRGVRYAGTRNFNIYGLGWFKRLFLALWDAKT